MESHGTSGRIQITRTTKELLTDEFVCEPRGTIPIKGKGEVEAWYLVGRRLSSLVAAEDRQEEQEDVQDVEEDRSGEQGRSSDVLRAAQPLEVEER